MSNFKKSNYQSKIDKSFQQLGNDLEALYWKDKFITWTGDGITIFITVFLALVFYKFIFKKNYKKIEHIENESINKNTSCKVTDFCNPSPLIDDDDENKKWRGF